MQQSCMILNWIDKLNHKNNCKTPTKSLFAPSRKHMVNWGMNLAYRWCWKMLDACICGSFRCRSCKMLLSSGTKSSDSWQLISRKLWRPDPMMHLMTGQTTWRRPSICHSKWCFCRNSWRRLESTVVSVVFFVSFFKTPLHLQVLPKSWMILLYLCCVFFNLRTHFADRSFNMWTHFADRDGGYVGLIVHKVCLCVVHSLL